MAYLRVGETYNVDVLALIADQSEHPHSRLVGRGGTERGVHVVTVMALRTHHTVDVVCECGAAWCFEDDGRDRRTRIDIPKSQGSYDTRRRKRQRQQAREQRAADSPMDRLAQRDDRRAQAIAATTMEDES